MEQAEKCGKDFRSEYIAYINQRSAEYDRQSAEYDRQSAEYDRQSAEAKMQVFTKSINDYNDFINKHKKFIDNNAVEDAYIIISRYKERIGELQKRLENLRVAMQNSQGLSAPEAESLKENAGQLLSDIDEQRAAMFKQRLVVVERNCAAIEKKITETQQKIASAGTVNDMILQEINKAKEEIVKAKQYIDKANANVSENSLKSAEYSLISAEADRRSAEARQQSINAINSTFEAVIDFYTSYQKSPDLKRLESFKPKVEWLISRCKDL